MDKKKIVELERQLVIALYKNSYEAFELEECRAIAHRYADWFRDQKFIEMGPNELSKKLIVMMLQNTDKRRYMAYKPTKIIGFYREDVENQTPRGIELEEICKEAAFGFFFEMLDDGQITATEVADLMKLPVEEVEQEYQEYRGYQSKCPYFKSRCPLFKCEYPHFKSECPFFKKKCPLA